MKQGHFGFTIGHRDKKSKAKAGEIRTKHGMVRRPGFVPVGTAASIKSLTPEEIIECNIDIFFVNTYHMLFRPGIEMVQKSGGLHKFMNWKGPVMTDSGGFQVFFLGEFGPRQGNFDSKQQIAKITERGIYFTSVWDGKKVFLGPNESIAAQQSLGSDIMMAFDECTFYPITKKRAQEALKRTHNWIHECIDQKNKRGEDNQALFGLVQGSVFEDLRVLSAKYMSNLPVEGFAIGSVANSREPREKVFEVLDWTMSILLPIEKPIHFLGIGEIEDIFLSVERGIDMLDCVTPTRLGRMGWIFSKEAGLKNKFRYDITKASFALDKNPPVDQCGCYACKNFTRAYVPHLFRSRELLAYRLATIHNLWFFGNLMEKMRQAIAENSFLKLKKDWLGIF